jgi:hypothetical protein
VLSIFNIFYFEERRTKNEAKNEYERNTKKAAFITGLQVKMGRT